MITPKRTEFDALSALRDADPLRYTAVLYVPEDKRAPVTSIWLFQSEIARIRDLISEPLPGEIRLQWWRDVLLGLRDSEAMQNPLAVDLLEMIDANSLSLDLFVTFLDAMTFDLYDDPLQEAAGRYTFQAICWKREMYLLTIGVRSTTVRTSKAP